MSEYLIQSETLTGIADAIRGKIGGTKPVAVSDMAAQIEGIQAGGGDIDALIDRSITEISSNVTSIGANAFSECPALTTTDFPMATSIDVRAFQKCPALTTTNFPMVTTVGMYAFYESKALTTIDLAVATSIKSMAFGGCSKLKALILRNQNAVCELSSSSDVNGTLIKSGTGYIYVPSALIEQYKVATNWSAYAAQFRALEDYTVDGTVTGELDESKI